MITVNGTQYEFKTTGDVQKLTQKEMVAIFNHLTGKNLTRFRTKEIGLHRTLVALGFAETKRRVKKVEATEPEAPKAPAAEPEAPKAEAPAPKPKGKKAAKAKKPAKRRKAGQSKVARGLSGRSSIASTAKITLCVGVNPKRHKSKARERFDLYKDGMTVEQFVAAGGLLDDIRWDVKHEFISLS